MAAKKRVKGINNVESPLHRSGVYNNKANVIAKCYVVSAKKSGDGAASVSFKKPSKSWRVRHILTGIFVAF